MSLYSNIENTCLFERRNEETVHLIIHYWVYLQKSIEIEHNLSTTTKFDDLDFDPVTNFLLAEVAPLSFNRKTLGWFRQRAVKQVFHMIIHQHMVKRRIQFRTSRSKVKVTAFYWSLNFEYFSSFLCLGCNFVIPWQI